MFFEKDVFPNGAKRKNKEKKQKDRQNLKKKEELFRKPRQTI